MNLTETQLKILISLAGIKKHNSIKKNIRQVLSVAKYNKEDLNYLAEQKLIRFTMMNEYQLTDIGEKELKNNVI